ncbi:tagatose 1,6-diphosphate aldolase [Dictyobacter aurantiacus]|uniref:tagatose-bisphosphate aldolase n=1 Tax=Dictyobacter aurantiacus TaxID=1936993 RepID=A0A401ZLE9_9CHLR|nr:tagatose 1,6-diphosphate aldolase [Dictyobacter aurantiacus]GCE07648.1 tagatose 1,6-diphosphate aldolase [Dictyobacter aurantiacus]
MAVKMSHGKFTALNACSNEQGVIAALAVDHRLNLLQAIAEARGARATVQDLQTFKATVTRVLSPYASALLLDPEYGLEAITSCAPSTAVMLAYEKSGYTGEAGDRLPDLLPAWSVRRLVEAGARAIKILLYYNPRDHADVNARKQAYIERVGAECAALDIPFFLEPLVYDHTVGGSQGLAFARQKPAYVTEVIAEFGQPRYGVDVLKVELPINPAFVAGTRAFTGDTAAYTRRQALTYLREATLAATLPLIYLSAGVSDAAFCEMLELAAEAGARFAGVLCGRATWQGGIPIYAQQGQEALTDWLAEHGARNIQTINRVVVASATGWWDVYGGRDAIEIV